MNATLHNAAKKMLKKLFLGTLLLSILVISCENKKDSEQFHLAADFHPAESTGFIWTTEFDEIVPRLTGIISQKDQVTLYIQEKQKPEDILPILKKYNSNLDNVELIKISDWPQNTWIRDFGPCYLVNDKGEKKIADFNYYGKATLFNDELATEENIPLEKNSLSSTGGARETNGRGTLILVESHEMETNSKKTKQEIENELIKSLNLKKIIWLKQGIPQDDNQANGPIFDQIYPNGLNGHIDEFCRFANENTILISHISEAEAKKHPIMAEAKRRLDENFRILSNSTDQDGNKFNIVRVPFAPLFIFQESAGNVTRLFTYVTSYLNFIVTNSFVIVPSYTENLQDFNRQHYIQAEKEVKNIFEKLYPDKEIIQVQATELNRYGGGFHCISINHPNV